MNMIVKLACIFSMLQIFSNFSEAMVSRRIVPDELNLPQSDERTHLAMKEQFDSANSNFDIQNALGSFVGHCEVKYVETGTDPKITFVSLPNRFILDVQKMNIPNSHGALFRSKKLNESHVDFPASLNVMLYSDNKIRHQKSVRRIQKEVVEDQYTAATLYYKTLQVENKWIGLWDFLGTTPKSISNPTTEQVQLAKSSDGNYFARFDVNWSKQFQSQMPIQVSMYCGPLIFVPEKDL